MWQLPGGKAGCQAQVTSPPTSHLPNEPVHAGRKQRIKELKAANNNQEEKNIGNNFGSTRNKHLEEVSKIQLSVCMQVCIQALCSLWFSISAWTSPESFGSIEHACQVLRSSCQLSVTCSTRVSCVCRRKVVLHAVQVHNLLWSCQTFWELN